MKTWLESFGAVVAGLVAGAVVVMALTYAAAVLFFGGDFTAPPTAPYLVANLTYSFGAAGLAGWLAGRLAPQKPLAHSAAVALVMLLLSVGGGGEAPSESGVPAWYGPALMVFMPLGALVGGWLYASRASSTSEGGTVRAKGDG